MNNEIENMTPAQRDALAERALKMQKSSQKRAKEYRERKRAVGLTQITTWVHKGFADEARQIYQKHADEHLAEKSKKETAAAAATAAGKASPQKSQNPVK